MFNFCSVSNSLQGGSKTQYVTPFGFELSCSQTQKRRAKNRKWTLCVILWGPFKKLS